jgi:hypothetical protein
MIVLYKSDIPIHVDYNYKDLSEIKERVRDKDAIILLDRSGELAKVKEFWKTLPVKTHLSKDELQYFEDRFWTWCWYGYAKIARGELWEARFVIEYLRINVLLVLTYASEGLFNEGSRRLENKFKKENLELLKKTIPKDHDKNSYREALVQIMSAYVNMFDSLENSDAVKKANREYFLQVIK